MDVGFGVLLSTVFAIGYSALCDTEEISSWRIEDTQLVDVSCWQKDVWQRLITHLISTTTTSSLCSSLNEALHHGPSMEPSLQYGEPMSASARACLFWPDHQTSED